MLTALLVLDLLTTTPIALPGGPPVSMDYLALDSEAGRLWVPAGNTGRVDVVDLASGQVTAIEGFATRPATVAGRSPMGPSSATAAGGTVWVGSRGDDSVCAFDARTLARGACQPVGARPDGLQAVPATRELWVTTPSASAIAVLPMAGGPRAVIPLEGQPEGYALDEARGLFFTSYEDKDRTVAIDVKTRKVVATFTPGCGKEGPRGLALDAAAGRLFVACSDGAVVLDVGKAGAPLGAGAVLGRAKTGGGVDNIALGPGGRKLYVAAGRTGELSIFEVTARGALSEAARVPTAKGARCVVVDGKGAAWVPDSAGGRILQIR